MQKNSEKLLTHCKHDNAPLQIKEVKRSASQLTKPYYYTAYYFCPQCKRMYFTDEFKVENTNFLDFTTEMIEPKTYDVEIWTDGASSNNGRPTAKASWAFVSGTYEECDFVHGKQTNNVAEATAILKALDWAGKNGHRTIRLHTDSQISIHGVMKPVHQVKENREIFQAIRDVIERYKLFVTYEKVLGHSGNVNNERADRLAAGLVGKNALK